MPDGSWRFRVCVDKELRVVNGSMEQNREYLPDAMTFRRTFAPNRVAMAGPDLPSSDAHLVGCHFVPQVVDGLVCRKWMLGSCCLRSLLPERKREERRSNSVPLW